jgi:hypothetical protein
MIVICVEISWLSENNKLSVFTTTKDALAHAWKHCSEIKKGQSKSIFNKLNEAPSESEQDDDSWATINFYNKDYITFSFKIVK